MNRLQELLASGRVDMQALESYLDAIDGARRKREVLSLGRAQQRRLFDAAEGHRPIGLDHLVGDDTPNLTEVVHHGLNTLPAFRTFAKVFARPDRGEGELWGYNRNPTLIETAVGPGYFIAHDHHVPGELLVNYLLLPPRGLPGWPAVIPNSERLSRFVYHGTQDVLRGVSRHVCIGRAQKGGRFLPAWFVLVRD